MKVDKHLVFLVLLLLISIVLLSTPLVIERFFINTPPTKNKGTLYIWNNWSSKSKGYVSSFLEKAIPDDYTFLKDYFNKVVTCDAVSASSTTQPLQASVVAKKIIKGVTPSKYQSCGNLCKPSPDSYKSGIMIDFEVNGQYENIYTNIKNLNFKEVIITGGNWETLFKKFPDTLFTNTTFPCPKPAQKVKILVQIYSDDDLICLDNPTNWWNTFITNGSGNLSNKACWTKPLPTSSANPISKQIIPAISCGKTLMDNNCWKNKHSNPAKYFATILEQLLKARSSAKHNNILDLCLYLG